MCEDERRRYYLAKIRKGPHIHILPLIHLAPGDALVEVGTKTNQIHTVSEHQPKAAYIHVSTQSNPPQSYRGKESTLQTNMDLSCSYYGIWYRGMLHMMTFDSSLATV